MEINKSADLLFLGGGTNVSTSRNKQAIFSEVNKNFDNALDLILSGRYERLDNESSFDPKFSFKYSASEKFYLGALLAHHLLHPRWLKCFPQRYDLEVLEI